MTSPLSSKASGSLVESLAEKMSRCWQQGERPLAEEYLDLHPQLWEEPEAVLELLYEEIHLRQEHGQEICAEELLTRFPRWRRQVQALLQCHHLLAPRLAGPALPAAGETLGEFRLFAELGRGAHSRVFLAVQPPLADRPVVLKLTSRAGREHLSLARLQHTHIVPLHSVHDFPRRRLRALCLPYFGGATLDQVLKAMQGRPPAQRTGQHIRAALAQTPPTGLAIASEGPCCRFLARVSYVQAVCWIGACLADALHYAHERGLLHLDLKPSNVLLAADGQPMLLDFHLARAPIPAGSSPPRWLGGTPGAMPPEQQAALDAVARRRPVAQTVDGRADVYALGVLLYEMLAGQPPPPAQAPARSLRRLNPRVSVGLADLIARCLRPAPEDRYPTASALATDLRRHLADLPLQGVSNRSLVERWGKWRRRRRQALPLIGLLFAVSAAIAFALSHVGRQVHKAQAALREGQGHLAEHRYAEALDVLKHGKALVDDLPFLGGLEQQLQDGIHEAERGSAAGELHRLSEQVRPLYSATLLPAAQARTVEGHCLRLWHRRDLILQHLSGQPDSPLTRQVRADLLDVAILAVHLRVRLAPANRVKLARQQGLAILDEAEALFGPTCVLCRERQAQAQALGQTQVAQAAARQAADLPPRTAWEHCAVGLVYYRAGDYERAAEEMDHALRLEPNSLWPSFYRGSCAYHLGQLEEASTAFSVCVALAPQCAWCYVNRALAHGARGRLDRALQDYNHALQLDPTLGADLLRQIKHER